MDSPKNAIVEAFGKVDAILGAFDGKDQMPMGSVLEIVNTLKHATQNASSTNMLALMMYHQNALEERILGDTWRPWDGTFPIEAPQAEYLTCWTDKWCTAISQEVAETRDWTPWKHWSQRLGNKNDNIIPWSPEHVKEVQIEIIDMLFFWMCLAMIWGLNANTIYTIYLLKLGVNHERQDTGTY